VSRPVTIRSQHRAHSVTYIDPTRRDSTMLRTVALLALVAGASAYQTDEVFYTHVYNVMTCGELETEATCTANTECVWDDNDGCDLNAIDKAVVQNDLNAGVNGLMSSTPGAACGAITLENIDEVIAYQTQAYREGHPTSYGNLFS